LAERRILDRGRALRQESGVGREDSHHGMEEYVEIKYVMMAGV
jgi:acyl-CoA reductase-like NAD-dependent aldehyde dehydrogenase